MFPLWRISDRGGMYHVIRLGYERRASRAAHRSGSQEGRSSRCRRAGRKRLSRVKKRSESPRVMTL